MTTIQLGPFSFSAPLLLGLAAFALAIVVAARFDRRHGTRAEGVLWLLALAALLAGRGVFVIRHFDAYRPHLLGMLDLRDGGFSAGAAIASALLVMMLTLWRRPTARRPVLLGALAGVAALGMGYASMQLWGQQNSLHLNDSTLTRLDGRTLRLSDLQGKPTVINLWASWCPPCRREMPALQAGQQANPDINFVFANQGESAAAIEAYLKQEQLSLDNVMLDPHGELARDAKSSGLPTTLFLDASGSVVDIRLGELSAASLNDRLSRLR